MIDANDSNLTQWGQDFVKRALTTQPFSQESEYEKHNPPEINVVLTFDGTRPGKVIRFLTGSEYVHSLIGFNRNLDELYSYQPNVGFGKENLYAEEREGSLYSFYSVRANEEAVKKVKEYIKYLSGNEEKTRYNYKGLINAWLGKEIFNNKNTEKRFCSEFVASTLQNAGINLLKDKHASTLTSEDIVKSTLIKHIKRGVLPPDPDKKWFKDRDNLETV